MPKTDFDDPRLMMLEMMSSSTMGVSGAIERSEFAGQRALVGYQMIPKKTGGGADIEQHQLEALGFTSVQDDEDFPEMFWVTRLPSRWTLAATEHAMWSHVKDSAGRLRMRIFYKASVYDRRAHAHITTELEARDET